MTNSPAVRLTGTLAEKVRSLLGGSNPTPKRVDALLDEMEHLRAYRTRMTRTTGTSGINYARSLQETDMPPLDESDRDAGRTPHRGAGIDPELARQRLAERIEANQARGLSRHAPAVESGDVSLPDASPPVVGLGIPPSPIQDGNEMLQQQMIAKMGLTTEQQGREAVGLNDDDAEIERLKSEGLSKTRQVFEARERRVLQQMPTLRAAGRSLRTLEEAADVLMAELQPNHQDEIRQVCVENDLPNWVVILGAVARMADLKELHAGEFEPDWRNRGSAVGQAVVKEQRCEMCDGVIPPDPIRRGQRFCCSRHGSDQVPHSDGCSLAHRKMVSGKWVDTVSTA